MELIDRIRGGMETGPGRWVAIAVIVLALGGAAVLFFARGNDAASRVADRKARGIPTLVYCKACKASSRVRIKEGQQLPVECPKCGAPQAVAGLRCNGCDEVFPIPDKLVYKCPKCDFRYDDRPTKPPGGAAAGP